jgi:hypothetical protein
MHLEKLSKEELRNILLTCDGKGKAIKDEALDELLQRARDDGAEAERDSNLKY